MNDAVKTIKTAPLAIWSLVLGVLSLFCLGVVTGIPAVICGHIARSNVRKSQGTLLGSGMALAGLILGYFGTVVITIGILIAIAIPGLISVKDKAYCSMFEAEAKKAASSVTCYFVTSENDQAPTVAELATNTECQYSPGKNMELVISGTFDRAKVTMIDSADICNRGDKYIISLPYEATDGWQ